MSNGYHRSRIDGAFEEPSVMQLGVWEEEKEQEEEEEEEKEGKEEEEEWPVEEDKGRLK